MRNSMRVLVLTIMAVAWFTPGCSKKDDSPGQVYKIGLIAKSESNPVFLATRVGAEDAARELGKKYGIKIEILWRTPAAEDAQKQASLIEQLLVVGADGIAISCSDATKVTGAINAAVDKGVPVVCFDADAPDSKRFVYCGTDDVECGKQVMRELAEQLGPAGGKFAVLAGNQTAPNLQARTRGVREELAKHPACKLVDVYYHSETPQDAAAKVQEVQTANPDIVGWVMVGGWALFSDGLTHWPPGKVKIVSVDALPAQLKYLDLGVAQALYGQRVHQWGYRSVELLIDKLLNGKAPQNVRDIMELDRVTKDNVNEYRKNWDNWLKR
ncbi:MAG TPA: substrate-binding domain-containing protein [Phycisphaerae bacterium]|nr:substrate-binding domain-containing protein [Phycisphaerae bacterium]